MIEADSQTNLTGGNDLKICDLKQEIIQNDERVELIEEDLSNDFKKIRTPEIVQYQEQPLQQQQQCSAQWPLMQNFEPSFRNVENFRMSQQNFDVEPAFPVVKSITRHLPLRYNPLGRLSPARQSTCMAGITAEQYHNYAEMNHQFNTHPGMRYAHAQQFGTIQPNGPYMKTDHGHECLRSMDGLHLPENLNRFYTDSGVVMSHNMSNEFSKKNVAMVSQEMGHSFQKKVQRPDECTTVANVPNSKKKKDKQRKPYHRTVFSDVQLSNLHRAFEKKKYLSLSERADLAHLLGLTQAQNKRAKLKRLSKRAADTMQITDARSEIHKQIHSVDSENNSIRQEKSTMVPTPSSTTQRYTTATGLHRTYNPHTLSEVLEFPLQPLNPTIMCSPVQEINQHAPIPTIEHSDGESTN